MKATLLALPLLLGLAAANSLPPTAEPPPTRKAEAQPADSIGDLKASRMESVLGYLEFTDPPYFGSERLEKLLEAEPEDLQMQPAPPFDE